VVCGNGSERLFTLSGGGISLDGFVVNGSGVTVLSDRNVISNNTIVGGDILLPVRTGGNSICDNVLEGGDIGVSRGTVTIVRGNTLLNGSIALDRSYDLTVRDNLIAGGGLTLENVADGAFFNNTISDNPEGCAFDVRRSFCNIIAGNTIRECGCGFRTGESANYVYLNTFVNNTIHAAAVGEGPSNHDLWASPAPVPYVFNGSAYVGMLGNYWDDHTGTDSDGDGVFEGAYLVGESTGADPFPLASPGEAYTVTYADERP
jgi:nitrous oxidase accessory protein NosD